MRRVIPTNITYYRLIYLTSTLLSVTTFSLRSETPGVFAYGLERVQTDLLSQKLSILKQVF